MRLQFEPREVGPRLLRTTAARVQHANCRWAKNRTFKNCLKTENAWERPHPPKNKWLGMGSPNFLGMLQPREPQASRKRADSGLMTSSSARTSTPPRPDPCKSRINERGAWIQGRRHGAEHCLHKSQVMILRTKWQDDVLQTCLHRAELGCQSSRCS